MALEGLASPLEGRWYCRLEDGSAEVELYLDVHDELVFQAVQFHRGGPGFRSEQGVSSIEARRDFPGGGEVQEIDLRVVRSIRDGRDRTPETEGAPVKGLFRKMGGELLWAVSAPNGNASKMTCPRSRFSKPRSSIWRKPLSNGIGTSRSRGKSAGNSRRSSTPSQNWPAVPLVSARIAMRPFPSSA